MAGAALLLGAATSAGMLSSLHYFSSATSSQLPPTNITAPSPNVAIVVDASSAAVLATAVAAADCGRLGNGTRYWGRLGNGTRAGEMGMTGSGSTQSGSTPITGAIRVLRKNSHLSKLENYKIFTLVSYSQLRNFRSVRGQRRVFWCLTANYTIFAYPVANFALHEW